MVREARAVNPFVLKRTFNPTNHGPVMDYRAVDRPQVDDPKAPGTSEPLAEEQLPTDVPTPTPSTPSSESAKAEELQASSSAGDAPSPSSAKPTESPTESATESGLVVTKSTGETSIQIPATTPTIPTPTITTLPDHYKPANPPATLPSSPAITPTKPTTKGK